MEKHYGQIVEYIVRKNGCSITELARGLNVNRRSVYNYFQNKYLKYDIIYKIGQIVRHDFSKELPELFTSDQFEVEQKQSDQVDYSDVANGDVINWQEKYIQLLEKYNEVLKIKVENTDTTCQAKT